ASEQAQNRQAANVWPHAERISATAGQRRRAGNSDHDQRNSGDPPEAEFPPHAAAVDDEIGIKRHGRYSLLRCPGRTCGFAGAWKITAPSTLGIVLVALFTSFALALERRAQKLSQGRAGTRRAILSDRFLLLGDFQRFDRNRHAARAAVEMGDASIDLFADGETVRTLLRAIARELRTLDEGGEFGASDLDLDAPPFHLRAFPPAHPALLPRGDFAGDHRALLQIACCGLGRGSSALRKLLDTERDALFLDIDIEHLRFDLVALLIFLDYLLAGPFPVEVRQVHHTVDVT